MMNDPLANAMSNILNAEKVGKRTCEIKPASKIIVKVLDIMKAHGYINTFEVVDNGKGGLIKVELKGNINKCGAIKPRFDVTKGSFLKYEKRYLPSEDFGLIIMSTSKGIMTHTEAKEKGLGGKLISYVY